MTVYLPKHKTGVQHIPLTKEQIQLYYKEHNTIYRTSTQVYVTASYVSLVVDSDQAGTLKWMSGQTLSSSNYTNWSPHYPQKHPNQTDCGKVEAGKTAVLSLYITKYCKYYI